MRKFTTTLCLSLLLFSNISFAFTKRAKFTFNNPPSSTLTNYVAFLYISNAAMKTVANGGNVTSSSCFDCVLYTDSTCTTRADYEQVSYDGVNGIWTGYGLIASFPTSSPPNLYLCFADSSVTTDQTNKFTLWATDANYTDVFHWGGAGGSIVWTNSATSGHDYNVASGSGFTNATYITGPFTGLGGISMTSSSTLITNWGGQPSGANARTIEIFYKVVTSNAGGDGENFIFGYGGDTATANNNFGFDYYKNAIAPCTTEMIAWTNSSGNPYWCYSLDSNWHYVEMSAPNSATLSTVQTIFDGTTISYSGGGGSTALNTTGGAVSVRLNGSPTTDFQPNQAVQYSEFRISADQKSTTWAATTKLNLSSVTTFETVVIENVTTTTTDGGCLFMVCTP